MYSIYVLKIRPTYGRLVLEKTDFEKPRSQKNAIFSDADICIMKANILLFKTDGKSKPIK